MDNNTQLSQQIADWAATNSLVSRLHHLKYKIAFAFGFSLTFLSRFMILSHSPPVIRPFKRMLLISCVDDLLALLLHTLCETVSTKER